MYEIITYGGGEILRDVFNGIAMMSGMSTYLSAIKIAVTVGAFFTLFKVAFGYSFKENILEHFNNAESVLIEKTNKKGKIRKLELKEFVSSIKITNETEIEIDIKKIDGITVRPEIVLNKIFSLTDEFLNSIDIIKLKNF